MPDTPTPGQVAYAAYEAALPERAYFPAPSWATVPRAQQRAWEAAAQAGRDAWPAPPRLETPAREATHG